MKSPLLQKRATSSPLLSKKAHEDETGEEWEKLPQPTWDDKTKEWKPQKGRGGVFSGESANYSDDKVAAGWGADDDRFHARQEDSANSSLVRTVWDSIHSELRKLRKTVDVEPGKPLAQYDLPTLSTSTDPAEKKAWYRVCTMVNKMLTDQFDPQQIAKFKELEQKNIPQALSSDKVKKAYRKQAKSKMLRRKLP